MPVEAPLRGIGRSVFLKIFAVFAGALVLITAYAGVSYMRAWRSEQPAMGRAALNYAVYVVDEIGVPPDTVVAREIAERTGMGIRISGPDIDWAVPDEMPDFSEVELPESPPIPFARAGLTRNFGFGADITRGDYRYLVNLIEDPPAGLGTGVATRDLLNVLFTIAVLICVYLLTRRILRPIRVLSEGVNRMRRGDLEVHMDTRRTDELGQLIRSFNEMARTVKERIEARDKLLLDVSHEIRSPLTRMKVALEMIPPSAARESVAGDIEETEAMIAQLLETERLDSRHGGLNVTDVDIAGLLRDCVADQPSDGRGIEILGAERAVVIPVDAERIRVVFKNVLSNAAKYSSPRGEPVRVVLDVDADAVLVSVHDHGVGIAPNDMRHIFEPFFRADRSRSKETGGYGLGLSLSKRIVEAHRGSIEVSSELGRGTSVLVSLPLAGAGPPLSSNGVSPPA